MRSTDNLSIIDKASLELTAIVAEGKIGGTPDYCSIEQWFVTVYGKSLLIDGRTDILSIGVIFYEMMIGRPPSTYDPDNIDVQKPWVNPPSKFSPMISTQPDKCILKMIELKPENRQHSIWDVISELEILPDNSLG